MKSIQEFINLDCFHILKYVKTKLEDLWFVGNVFKRNNFEIQTPSRQEANLLISHTN